MERNTTALDGTAGPRPARASSTFDTRPIPLLWRAAVAVLAIWSLGTDLPGLLGQADGFSTLSEFLPSASLILLTLGPLLATVRCWQGSVATLVGACFELNVPASPALFFLALTVLVSAFAGSRRVSNATLAAVLLWMTVNAALIPQDYLIINVVLAIGISLLYGICRAGIRSREQLELTTAAGTQAELDHAEILAASRRQMTRDLHDVIAHDVTIIALQADVALSTQEPNRQRQSLEAISESAHAALTDLRSMMKVLSPVAAPQESPLDASLAKSAAMIAGNLRRLGYPTNVSITGDLDSLPANIQVGVLPVLRECGTNVIVHSTPGSTVEVNLTAGRKALELRISNGAAADIRHTGRIPKSGFGLGFMRERIERLGGTLDAERSGSQWVVDARIPLVPPRRESP